MPSHNSNNNTTGQTDVDDPPPPPPPPPAVPPAAEWDRLSWDLTELILCRLPLRTLVRAGAVCRQWRAVVTHPSLQQLCRRRRRPPWLFLYAHHNLVPRLNRAFAFDPSDAASSWISLPPSSSPLPDSFSGSGGFSFSFLSSSPYRLSFSPLLRPQNNTFLSPPLSFPRSNPLVSVLSQPNPNPSQNPPRGVGVGGVVVVVVGGARLVGGLVDIEDRLPVEIYDPGDDAWELGPPLPAEFRPGYSSQWLSAALLPRRGLLFVLATYSCVLSAFDLARRTWTRPRPLRPRAGGPAPLFAFLATAPAPTPAPAPARERLVLAGLRSGPNYGPAQFAIWAVDDASMECEEVGAMPRELLAWLLEGAGVGEDDDNRFASLKCAGADGVVYVFNEDHHKGYPACVCEISDAPSPAPGMMRCAWRKVPPLPGPVDRFHKVIAFCSPVPLHPVLAAPPP